MRSAAAIGATLVTLLVLGLSTACGSSSTSSTARLNPKQMVLQRQDVPTEFRSAPGSGYKSAAAAARLSALSWPQYKALVARYKAWGYVTGYVTSFTRIGSAAGHGSMEGLFSVSGETRITSTAGVYKTSAGAEKSLAFSAKACSQPSYRKLSVNTTIGDEVLLCASFQNVGPVTEQTYSMIWRRGRVRGVIYLTGLKGSVSPRQAIAIATKETIALAQRQDARMRARP